jgi:lipid-binding SYLF domain-containing protein
MNALERLDAASQIIDSFRDKIPPDALSNAQCVIAIPSMTKGGIIVGGASGSGYATCKSSKGWSAPTPISIRGGDFGTQIGFEETDVVSLVTSGRATHSLASGRLRVARDDVTSYSRSRAAFADIDLDGTLVELDGPSARALYGEQLDASLYLSGAVRPPADESAQRFLTTVRSVFGDGARP